MLYILSFFKERDIQYCGDLVVMLDWHIVVKNFQTNNKF